MRGVLRGRVGHCVGLYVGVRDLTWACGAAMERRAAGGHLKLHVSVWSMFFSSRLLYSGLFRSIGADKE